MTMKKYIGKKEVSAEPMTMGDAYGKGLLQSRRVPTEAEINSPGYHVVYQDGYESWSPKDAFDKGYRLSETFRDRLVIEREDLYSRYRKLGDFLDSDKFAEIVNDNDCLGFSLEYQYYLMGSYLRLLNMRIKMVSGESGQSDDVSESLMSFDVIISALKNGFAVRRDSWENNKIVFLQVPAQITGQDSILGMKSIPSKVKSFIAKREANIAYDDQCIVYDIKSGEATYWVPNIEDIMAENWLIIV